LGHSHADALGYETAKGAAVLIDIQVGDSWQSSPCPNTVLAVHARETLVKDIQ
jgi:hypothetical protein